MAELNSVVAATVDGRDLSLQDLMHGLKLQGRLRPLIAEAVVERLIAEAAEREGVTVSDAELQKAADAFPLRAGLNKAADTQRWLARHHLTQEELEEGLERALRRQKLAEKVAGPQVEKHFAENRRQFDRARLRQLVVGKEGVAQELLSRVQEEDADFAELARQHALDPTARESGGVVQVVPRSAVAADVEAAVFAAKSGDVVGPFSAPRGHVLIQVEELLPGQLDVPTRAAIQEVLFRKWLAEQVQKARVEIKLEQYLAEGGRQEQRAQGTAGLATVR
jgi:parvulin-like peptidyl-prolyl isomerase